MMLDWLRRLLGSTSQKTTTQPPKLIMTQACVDALKIALEPSQRQRHEGIAYVLGRSDGFVTLGTTVFMPRARTTGGSFYVEPGAMAACMQAAALHELQVVAQVHTHPGEAYHSDGDVEGAKIRYPGYASVVLPKYGSTLPSLAGAAAFLWRNDAGWIELSNDDVIIIPGAGPWTSSSGMKN